MSGVVVRRVASTPTRTASETWNKIMALLAPDPKSSARGELERVAGVACSSISSEATKDDAIVVHGNGPRIRVYCVFGDDAITGENVNEDAFHKSPTEGDWAMSIPCLPEDLAWSRNKLSSESSRVTARATGEDVPGKGSKSESNAGAAINVEEFLRS